jgi:hypothetical protein
MDRIENSISRVESTRHWEGRAGSFGSAIGLKRLDPRPQKLMWESKRSQRAIATQTTKKSLLQAQSPPTKSPRMVRPGPMRGMKSTVGCTPRVAQPGDRAFGNSAPAHYNPSRPPLGVCRKCGKTGHREETCWAELVCARCGIQGHPAQVCRRPPCEACGTIHERGKCELWRDMEELKKVIKTGGSLSDMPEALKARLLGSR